MSNHHDHHDHHSDEKKPVAFTVPLIFASAVVVVILLLVSIGDPHHGCECEETCSKECMEACESGNHSMHDKAGHEMKHEEANAEHTEAKDTMAVETTKPEVADTAKAAHTEHNEAHH